MEEKQCDDLLDLREWIPGFRIDDSNRTDLCFRETLVISLKNNSIDDIKQVGGYCIQVECVGPQGREFLVHVHSSMTIDDYFSGTKLISMMTERLQCLEEKHTEFLHKKDGLHEKSLNVGLQENAYHVVNTGTCPFNVSPLPKSKDLKLCQYKNLISEGVSVLLMRYFAITNFEGTLHLQNILIDGEIATSHYICSALQDIKLYDHHRKVYTIERQIYKEDNLIQQVKIYMTPKGRILVLNWLDVPYVAQNYLLIQNKTEQESSDIPLEIPLRQQWMKDIRMVSNYLDTKSHNIVRYTDYMIDHPEIKQIIADYVQALFIGNRINQWIKFVPNLLRQLSKTESDITCGLCGICLKCKIASQFDKI